MKNVLFGALVLLGLVGGCATVDVTKTAKGFFPPTIPDDVEILMTKASQDYVELATISTTNWKPSQTAKMHNAIRAKTAPLGANAVLLTASGIGPGDNNTIWTTGVAIRYK
jgi:hypothetical protein